MAQKKISLRDRAIIKSRLARGLSYYDAMKWIGVRSKKTVKLIKKAEGNDIK